MEESTLIKSGEVSFQVKSLLKSSWVSKFCTLHKKTAENHAFMELYDDKQAFEDYRLKNKKCDIKKIVLHNVKSIRSSSENTGKGMEHHIEIRLKSQKHLLMFKHENDFTDWLAKLNYTVDVAERGSAEGSASLSVDSDEDDDDDEVITLNQMYASTETAQRFEVEVDPSDLAKLCGIEGKMTLLLGNTDLAFEDPVTKRVKYNFQFAWMRRFGKYKSQSFNFEVGRKCPNGEGSVTCKTASAKAIHKIVTQKSSSRSNLVIPHRHTDDDTSMKEKKAIKPSMTEEPPPPIKERQTCTISQPNLTNNMVRKHPGKTNIPNLIPLVRQETDDDQILKAPKTPPQPLRRSSKGKGKSSGKDSPDEEKKLSTTQDNDSVRPSSYRSAVQSGDFAKELEQKLQLGSEEHPIQDKRETLKSKEDKKKEKEERKEKERKEKEERKEREKREKELEKERKLREKVDRKSGKKDKPKDSMKSQDKHQMSMRERIYDEPGADQDESCMMRDDPAGTYDEVGSPMRKFPPAEYTQSSKIKAQVNKTEEMIYDEAVSPTQDNKVPEKVEYAEPLSKKGGVPVKMEPAMYADVKTVQKDAWKKLGRKETEEIFEEDYSNIKSAREQIKNQAPPPIPVKSYSEEEVDENMYNTVDLTKRKPALNVQSENLYGMASATEVGELPTNIVPVPEKDYPTDSDESEHGEEGVYDEAQYEGYEAPADLKSSSVKKTKLVDAYEEAVVPVPPTAPKQSLKKQVKPKELIYEEIS